MKSSLMVKTGGIYLVLSLISNFINIMLTPIYTNNLTLEEYGGHSTISSYMYFGFHELGAFQ